MHVPVVLAIDTHATLFVAPMAAGFVIGTFGHIIRSTPVILVGILLIGGSSLALLIASA